MQSKTLTKLFSNSGQKLLQHQGWPLTLDKSSLIINVNPDTMFFTRPKFFNSLPRSSSLVRSGAITAPSFSTSPKQVQLSSETLSSKLVGQEHFIQTSVKFFTRSAEEETVTAVEGVGWAGQPIVKRLHTILPEVQGDISDIFKVTKKTKAISEVSNNLEVQVRNFGRSHDIIAVINENARNKINENSNGNATRNRLLHTKKDKIYYQHPGIFTNNPKKIKKKKRTVVLASKPAVLRSSFKNKPKNKKNKTKKKRMANKRSRLQPTMALNRLFSTMPSTQYLFHVANRQFQTFSALCYAKAAVAVKTEKKVSALTITGKPKKGKTSKSASEPIFPADDCVCPEILYTKGKRKSTKICGEAAGAVKAKKKSSWKQKMCLVEPKDDPGRKKTFVCISEAEKQGKRKKDLPKCPEPEKKIAPRVVICEPNLEEEEAKKSKKKECVKIEEVKIRKRTKVCKPVIIFAKEEVGVKIEKKAVCSSMRTKKVISRHTQICLPPNPSKKK